MIYLFFSTPISILNERFLRAFSDESCFLPHSALHDSRYVQRTYSKGFSALARLVAHALRPASAQSTSFLVAILTLILSESFILKLVANSNNKSFLAINHFSNRRNDEFLRNS
jgi:hypothetical protein